MLTETYTINMFTYELFLLNYVTVTLGVGFILAVPCIQHILFPASELPHGIWDIVRYETHTF